MRLAVEVPRHRNSVPPSSSRGHGETGPDVEPDGGQAAAANLEASLAGPGALSVNMTHLHKSTFSPARCR
jgi:hypothetical protein